jgi:hypothetical protein
MKKLSHLYQEMVIENSVGKIFKITSLSILFFVLTIFNAFSENSISNDSILNSDHDAAIVSNLRAEYRYGQVFLIWDESVKNDKNLRVYISSKPINNQNLSTACLLIDQLEPHSADDWYDDSVECPRAKGPMHGWVIEPGRKPLYRQGGLFVHTVLKNDPQLAYFAVLGAQEDGNRLKTGVNSLQKPVAISVGKMQAIWQLQGTALSAKGKALAISLHSHLSRPNGLNYLFFGDSSMGWREGLPFKFKLTVRPNVVLLEPYDRVWINRKMSLEEAKANGTYDTEYKNIESWWYGTNSKINNEDSVSSGIPTNYTERWILWAMSWIQQNYGTDPNKVYAFGASMGTGILRMVLQNPNRFASVDLLVPILDPFRENNVGWRMAPRVGDPQSICSDGIKLIDRLNTIRLIKTAKTDLPPMVIRLGRSDKSVYWMDKPDFIKTTQEQKQALFAGWDNGTHHTAMRKHHEAFPDLNDFKWHINHFAINRSYPVFTGCSLDDDSGNGDVNVGDTTGYINHGLDWKVIRDTDSDYEILIMNNLSEATYPVYVNITPRRYQKFRDFNKSTVYACNINADGKVIEKKILKIDNDLITYDKFAITSAAGNTLLIKKIRRNDRYYK